MIFHGYDNNVRYRVLWIKLPKFGKVLTMLLLKPNYSGWTLSTHGSSCHGSMLNQGTDIFDMDFVGQRAFESRKDAFQAHVPSQLYDMGQ